MVEKTCITTSRVWPGNGMLSPAVKVGKFLFISGQAAFDEKGEIVGKGDMEAQTVHVFECLKSILEASGGTLDNIVRMRIYLTDLKNRPKFHEVRKRYFKGGVLPASTLLVVKSLASEELLVEVDADAVLD